MENEKQIIIGNNTSNDLCNMSKYDRVKAKKGVGSLTIGFQMFLLAAEEMSFSRAAERAFVTQQCLSDHIKRLEESYQVLLFSRKPKLKLTPEGEAMVKYLSRIQVLEDGMKKELSDINAGIRGKINFGIGSTRGAILVPQLTHRFRELMPNADIHVTLGDTQYLEQLLLNGRLDLFLGVTANQNVMFRRKMLAEERLYLIIPDCMLRSRMKENYNSCIETFAKGVDLSLMPDLPFVMGHENSRTTFGVCQYYMKHGLDFHVPVFVSDFNIHLKLCRTGMYATVAPHLHLHHLTREGQSADQEETLRIFPLLNIEQKYNVEIITHRETPPLKMLNDFSALLEQTFFSYNQEVSNFLKKKNIS